jgi:ATP-dependent phosphofructokinase / diphosphate-dependent phosphofructokinase
MIIELMGHNAGWITLYAGIAGGGDVILIPEIDYYEEKVAEYLLQRANNNKAYSIVVVAEGIRVQGKEKSAANYISKIVTDLTGLETRQTVLGYIQRGGTPSPMDRVLATRYGSAAADLIARKDFGMMVAMRNNEITSIKLSDVAGKTRVIEEKNPLVAKAMSMGTSFGT